MAGFTVALVCLKLICCWPVMSVEILVALVWGHPWLYHRSRLWSLYHWLVISTQWMSIQRDLRDDKLLDQVGIYSCIVAVLRVKPPAQSAHPLQLYAWVLGFDISWNWQPGKGCRMESSSFEMHGRGWVECQQGHCRKNVPHWAAFLCYWVTEIHCGRHFLGIISTAGTSMFSRQLSRFYVLSAVLLTHIVVQSDTKVHWM